jgi:hypothetical protein
MSKSLWEVIDVELPTLGYENVTTSGQGKGSTEWAPHSRTPVLVAEWTDFDALVQIERENNQDRIDVDVDLKREFQTTARRQAPISNEEQVTSFTNKVLEVFSDREYGLSGDFFFPARNAEIVAFPDLIAMKRVWGM